MIDTAPQRAPANQLLTSTEAIALSDCEERIERGMETFIEVGTALAAIRENRLYRDQYATFEEYCRERWGMTRQHVNRLVVAAEVVNSMEPMGSIPAPKSERQARALAAVPPTEREEIWREAVERTVGKPTARTISEVAKERADLKPGPERDLTSGALHVPTTEPTAEPAVAQTNPGSSSPADDLAPTRSSTPAMPWPVATDTPPRPMDEAAHAARVSSDIRRLITLAQTFGTPELRQQAVRLYSDDLGNTPMPPAGLVNAHELRQAAAAITALAKDWTKR